VVAVKIAVTPRSLVGHPALEALDDVVFPAPGRTPTRDELLAVLPDCDGYIAGVEPIDRELLEACPRLRVISRNGVGVDNIDLDAAAELGIRVETAGGSNAEGVAELAIALMLALVRNVSASSQALRQGRWERHTGFELAGRTLGVVGAGAIGSRVAEMALGLGMEVLASDPFPRGDLTFVALDELLARADVVTLHCPAGTEIDISRMRHRAFLINTARASLVDHDAVLQALESGALGGFATDVYPVEPPEPSPLYARDDVIAMPHAGGLTHESVDRAARAAVHNLLRVLNDQRQPAGA
jgi:D-3-phosphoglycerate dehydrogenase